MQVGKIQELTVSRISDEGLYLTDNGEDEVFMSKLFEEEEAKVGDSVQVFLYQDDRLLKATTEVPYCEVDEFAIMETVQVLPSGAFMDWGIIKDLFIPFKKQGVGIKEEKKYLVYCYLDEDTGLLTGTTKFSKIKTDGSEVLMKGEKVRLIIWKESELGWEVVINQKYFGLIYHSDVYKRLQPLSEETGYIKQVREDGKIDVTLQPEGLEHNDVFQSAVLNLLQKRGGILYLSDKSDPDEIKRQLQMSKKNFKKAIGSLYKAEKIEILDDRIQLK